MISVGTAGNSVTGRTKLRDRKKECPKFLKERRRRSRSYSDSRDRKYLFCNIGKRSKRVAGGERAHIQMIAAAGQGQDHHQALQVRILQDRDQVQIDLEISKRKK